MASKVVAADRAIPIYLNAGATVSFTNNDANNDVYLNADPNELNAAIPGGTPKGLKVAKAGGFQQVAVSASGKIWARATPNNAYPLDVD